VQQRQTSGHAFTDRKPIPKSKQKNTFYRRFFFKTALLGEDQGLHQRQNNAKINALPSEPFSQTGQK
jgi:hypothetical protein